MTAAPNALRIHRHTRVDHYTILPNDILQNDALSWAARGMLAYLLSLPPDWRLKTTDLIRRGQEGKARFYRIKAELEAAGFLRGTVSRTPQGVIAEWVWEVTDEAHCWPDSGKSESGETPVGSPDSGFPEGGKPRRWETQKVGNPEGGKPGNYKEHIDKELSDKEHTHKGEPEPGACVEDSPAAPSEPEQPGVPVVTDSRSAPTDPAVLVEMGDRLTLNRMTLEWETRPGEPFDWFVDYQMRVLPQKPDKATMRRNALSYIRKARTLPERYAQVRDEFGLAKAEQEEKQRQAELAESLDDYFRRQRYGYG